MPNGIDVPDVSSQVQPIAEFAGRVIAGWFIYRIVDGVAKKIRFRSPVVIADDASAFTG